MPPQDRLRIYTDGSCDFCRWARSLIEPYDRDGRLDFRDFNLPQVAAETPYAPVELASRMHVQTPDFNWHDGYWGWVEILAVLPRFRWLARMLHWIPFRWLGPRLYDFVARNRYKMPAPLLRFLGVPRPCDESCAIPVKLREQ
jgi:predicted DCC family thiol-disulfide oxidoreductase YuxK